MPIAEVFLKKRRTIGNYCALPRSDGSLDSNLASHGRRIDDIMDQLSLVQPCLHEKITASEAA